jgi:lipid-binding SYLF domain-containing protein
MQCEEDHVMKRVHDVGRPLLLACVFGLMFSSVTQARPQNEQARIEDSMRALRALMAAPDAIPDYVLERAEAIVVIPSLQRGGFIFGAERGQGVMSVRDRKTETWSAPAFVTLTGGSFGAQIGLQTVDLVLLIMNLDGVHDVLQDKFSIGLNASAAAGIGRSARAATDAKLSARILAYSRAEGLFLGATIDGASLRPDRDANQRLYGKRLETQDLAFEQDRPALEIPGIAQQWRDMLKTMLA